MQREASLARLKGLEYSDTVRTLEAIKNIIPDATPEQLTSIIKNLPAITSEAGKDDDPS